MRIKNIIKQNLLLYRTTIRIRNMFAYLSWLLKKPRINLLSLEQINLHLGCGEIDYSGFINIDARPKPHVHFVRRVDDLRIFKNNLADLIYVSHCLEHIPHRKVPETLHEWHRVLKPGGILRLSVPNFDLLLQIYLENDRKMESILQPLMGGQDYEQNFHYIVFNAGFLEQLLRTAGFKEVRIWESGTEPYTSVPDWSGKMIEFNNKKYPVSLNMEAVK